ncbi:hypothetical protein [Paenibacillus sp. MBLB4367]|uniref:hypothetical protein n=1 Tax=Paenibacillus sp. MBLB4367 TaxID=3384767 RepID=UPI0039081513
MQQGDTFVLTLVVIVLIVWLWIAFRRWLQLPSQRNEEWRVEPDEEIPVTEAVELLENSGYEVMTQKRRVQMRIVVDGSEEYASRLLIDHFVRNEDGIYIVKVMKEDKPLDWSGSGLRDELLAYHLLYPEAEGILVVDIEEQSVHHIQFHMLGESE